jgi:hypothetical protein
VTEIMPGDSPGTMAIEYLHGPGPPTGDAFEERHAPVANSIERAAARGHIHVGLGFRFNRFCNQQRTAVSIDNTWSLILSLKFFWHRDCPSTVAVDYFQ